MQTFMMPLLPHRDISWLNVSKVYADTKHYTRDGTNPPPTQSSDGDRFQNAYKHLNFGALSSFIFE